jgi:hypothetical protein
MTDKIPSPLCTKKLQLFDDIIPFSLNNYNAILTINQENDNEVIESYVSITNKRIKIEIINNNNNFPVLMYLIILRAHYGNNIDQTWSIIGDGFIRSNDQKSIFYDLSNKNYMLSQIDIQISVEFQSHIVGTNNKHSILFK